ncbi:hypothetical protein Pan97_16990 [Bremerella volcania]|uniref:Uncharacterized protein n=1 Tax=Bremerella volcania TaxID=2527984 RepID=A0A518C621_9BACT|nr:hypothetical protein Pan97_16990 [Bremerella volcania]
MVAGEPDLIGTIVHGANFRTTSQGADGDRFTHVTVWEIKPTAEKLSAETSGDLEIIIHTYKQ